MQPPKPMEEERAESLISWLRSIDGKDWKFVRWATISGHRNAVLVDPKGMCLAFLQPEIAPRVKSS